MPDRAITALLARHLPGYEVRSVVELGAGEDNVAHQVNGDLVVRRRREADPELRRELTRREADLLAAVGALLTLPVPEPVVVDPEEGMIAYPRLPGLPLLGNPVADPARLAPALGEFLSGLHRAPVWTMEALVPRDAEPLEVWRADAEAAYRGAARHLPAAARGAVEDFLGRTPPPEPRAVAFCHNDLGAEHLLADPAASTLTGVIDWGDTAIADPAYDLGLILRDLGPGILDLTVGHYDGGLDDAGRRRAVFYARCAVLEDIAYGVGSGPRRYADAGLARIDRIFED